jgi:hypothetical protein
MKSKDEDQKEPKEMLARNEKRIVEVKGVETTVAANPQGAAEVSGFSFLPSILFSENLSFCRLELFFLMLPLHLHAWKLVEREVC